MQNAGLAALALLGTIGMAHAACDSGAPICDPCSTLAAGAWAYNGCCYQCSSSGSPVGLEIVDGAVKCYASPHSDPIGNNGSTTCIGSAQSIAELCADPAAFDPAAVYEHLCSAMISADFTDAMCSAAGCYSTEADESGTVYCSCQVTDSDACLAKLPGEPR